MSEQSNKAVFTVSEPGAFSGHDLRKFQRRATLDRREMMRFEMEKEPRRSAKDRRALSSVWDDRPTL